MRVLIDCLLDWRTDSTHLFLLDVCQGLQLQGAEILRHAEFDSPFFDAVKIEKIRKGPQSTPKISVPPEALESLRECHKAWESDPKECEMELQKLISELRENSIDLVLTWSKFHPRSLAIRLAAKFLDIRVMVFERGLVPGSWVIATSHPWRDNLTTGVRLSASIVAEVHSLSLEAFNSRLLEKYASKQEQTAKFADEYDFAVLSGFASPMGSKPGDYGQKVNAILRSLQLAYPDASILFRSHPGCRIPISDEKVTVDNDSNLADTLRRSRINIIDGSNVWVASMALGKATILVDWQGDGGAESVPIADLLESLPNTKSLENLVERSREGLRTLLDESIASEHFFHNASPLPGVDHVVSRILKTSSILSGTLRTAPISDPGSIWVSRKFSSERDALVGERDALVGERDALVGERDALVGELETITTSKIWRWGNFLAKPMRGRQSGSKNLGPPESDRL